MSPESNESVASPAGQRAVPPLVYLALIAATNILVPYLPIPNFLTAFLGGVGFTIFYVGIVTCFALSVAKQRYTIPVALGWLIVCALAWTSIEYGVRPFFRPYFIEARLHHTEVSPSLQLLRIVIGPIEDAAMVAGAMFAGTILARLIRHPNMIGPIGAAIALIDIWGVLFGGIVSQLMTNKATQAIAAHALAAGPRVGGANTGHHGFAINIPEMGVGDFLFMALLLSALVNLKMNWRDSSRWMFALVTFALLSISFIPFIPALPGLLFIGAAAVLPNLKFYRYTREELFALLYAGIFVVIMTVGLYFSFKAALPPNPPVPKGQKTPRVDARPSSNS